MKTALFSVVCVLLTLTLVLTIVGFSIKIEKNEEKYASEMSLLKESLSEEIEDLESEIHAIKTHNASLFREILYEYKDPDPETGKVKLHITVYPKDVSETMTVEVGLEGQGMVPMQRHEGRFFLNLEVDIFGGNGAVYLNVRGEDVATGLEKTEIPTQYIWERFLPMPSVEFTGTSKIVNDNLSLYGNFSYHTSRLRKERYDTVGDIENVIIYVKKSGEIVERIYESGGDQTHGCPITYGDTVTLVARVRDSYGFTAEYLFGQYTLDEEYGLLDYSISCGDGIYSFVTVWGSGDIPLYDDYYLHFPSEYN